MKFLCLIIGSICFLETCYAATWKYSKCSSGKSIATIKNFSIYPDPILLNGKNSSISLDVSLHEDIPDGAHFKMSVWKVISLWITDVDYPVDCILPKGCFIEHCEFLKEFTGQACGFFPVDVKCGCPLKANIYKGDNVTITMPLVQQLGASGKFRMELKLLSNKQTMLFCYSFTGDIGT